MAQAATLDRTDKPAPTGTLLQVRDLEVRFFSKRGIVNAVNVCRENGAQDVYLAFTHGFLTSVTYQRLSQLNAKEIILTDTISQPVSDRLPNMTVLSVGPLLAEVMMRAHEGRSVGELFNE